MVEIDEDEEIDEEVLIHMLRYLDKVINAIETHRLAKDKVLKITKIMMDLTNEVKEELLSEVKVYDNRGKTIDRYTVVFPTGDIYLMSVDANMPNGVCTYAGNDQDIISDEDKRIDVDEIPSGTKQQIKNLMEMR